MNIWRCHLRERIDPRLDSAPNGLWQSPVNMKMVMEDSSPSRTMVMGVAHRHWQMGEMRGCHWCARVLDPEWISLPILALDRKYFHLDSLSTLRFFTAPAWMDIGIAINNGITIGFSPFYCLLPLGIGLSFASGKGMSTFFYSVSVRAYFERFKKMLVFSFHVPLSLL